MFFFLAFVLFDNDCGVRAVGLIALIVLFQRHDDFLCSLDISLSGSHHLRVTE